MKEIFRHFETKIIFLFQLFIFVLFAATNARVDTRDSHQGWSDRDSIVAGAEGPCTIPRSDGRNLTRTQFLDKFAFSEPVIITNLETDESFKNMCSREGLLREFSETNVLLSSANTYSYAKVPVSFGDYVDNYLGPQTVDKLGNETLYFFGDINIEDWQPLLDRYRKLPWTMPGYIPAPTIGVAGPGTGVPFHFHGPGFAEVIHGRKRWFLYHPDKHPLFDPDNSTLHWYTHVYPNLPPGKKPLECLLEPNEIIYFPNLWWHSTLNVETTVFISTFLSR